MRWNATLLLLASVALVAPGAMATGEHRDGECDDPTGCFYPRTWAAYNTGWTATAGWFHPDTDTSRPPTSNTVTRECYLVPLFGLTVGEPGSYFSNFANRMHYYYPTTNQPYGTSVDDPGLNIVDGDGNVRDEPADCYPTTSESHQDYVIGAHENSAVRYGMQVWPFSFSRSDYTITSPEAFHFWSCAVDDVDFIQSTVINQPLFSTALSARPNHGCEYQGDYVHLMDGEGMRGFDLVSIDDIAPDGGDATWSGLMVSCIEVNMVHGETSQDDFLAIGHDWWFLAGTQGTSDPAFGQTLSVGTDPNNWLNQIETQYDNGCPFTPPAEGSA